MTLYDTGPLQKKCFVYCGDDRCNCAGAPRYRIYGVDWGRSGADKTIMTEAELQADGTINILSFGEVIDGGATCVSDEPAKHEDAIAAEPEGGQRGGEAETPNHHNQSGSPANPT